MKIQNKLNLYLNEANELNWLAVKLDNGKKYVVLGFKNEKTAENIEDKLNNWSDVTVFSVDYYGKTNKITIENKYKPVKIFENPKIDDKFINNLNKLLK